jgi:hypothetical protein
MVLGRDDGQLCLVTNNGSAQKPTWGTLQSGFLGFFPNQTFTSKVAIGDVTADGLPDVLVSTGTKPLHLYKNPIFSISYTAQADSMIYQNQTFGQASTMPISYSSAPALADWNGDQLADIILGMGQGGIQYFENRLNKPLKTLSSTLRPRAKVIVNPSEALDLWSPEPAHITLFDALGRPILQETIHAGSNAVCTDTLVSGLYWVTVVFQGRSQQIRWIKSN